MKTIPALLAAIYLILVLLAVIPIFTGKDALSGIFAVALTAPWNSLLGRLLPAHLADTDRNKSSAPAQRRRAKREENHLPLNRTPIASTT
ncbi:MAG: hypothetical protein IT577_17195 [Verrucomicrobiae bacterium]|nr:hypothetical protein [Verrucomicrobiae bacterium]